ncbi:neurofilament heavy polypeptide-like [Cebidichthys violaceus]|uniref:neurofilament heavy polypeptide-like n=1 Tax=Cebidichthys violaceus TaxID=271503 RepID=UPI0035CC795A
MGKIPVQEAKTHKLPKKKSQFTGFPKDEEPEPEIIKLKKVPVTAPEPEKQVKTQKAEVTRLQDEELVVHELHDREDREIITLGRTERVFTAEEQTAQLGYFEEAEKVEVVQKIEKKGWTRTPKPQKEEEPEVSKLEKKKITKLPKADEQKDSTKLKPFQKSGKPEEEPQKIKLKKVPTKPKEPEKEVITHKVEVTRHYDTEMSVQKLRDRTDREVLTLGRTERVFTAAEEASDLGHMEEPENLETEDEKSRWIRTPKTPKSEEPEPDLTKKKINMLPKKDEEQEVVILKPFEKPEKPERAEPEKAEKEGEATTDTERTPFKRAETPQRDQTTSAIKHRKDVDAPMTILEVTPDAGKDRKEIQQREKPDRVPEDEEPEPEIIKLKKVPVTAPEPEKQVKTQKAEVTRLQDEELVVHELHDREDREIITLGRTERVFTAEEQTAQLGYFEEAEKVEVVQKIEKKGWTRTPKPQKEEEPEVSKLEKKKITKLPKADEQKDSTKLKPFQKSGKPEEEPQKIKLKKVPTKPKEPEKEVITHKVEVTRHYDTEMSVQKLHDRTDREVLTLGRIERVFTAAEEASDLGHMEEPENLETEDEKSRWITTPKTAKSEEPEPDLTKKKIKTLPKKDEEQEVVTLKPFEKPEKPERAEPEKAEKEGEATTDTERTPFKRAETPQRDQTTSAIKHRKDVDAPMTILEVTPDAGKDQKEIQQREKPDRVPKDEEPSAADKLRSKPKVISTPEKEKEQVMLKPFTKVSKPEEKPEEDKTKLPSPTFKKEYEEPQEKDKPAVPPKKPSPPGKKLAVKEIPPKQTDILKKGVELKKTPSPRVAKDKVEEEKPFKPIEQLKRVELKKTPSPKVDKPKEFEHAPTEKKPSVEKVKQIPKTVSPKDSVTLKKIPKKPSPEEAPQPEQPGRVRIPLEREVSPGAVQMKKVPTQPEEEVFEDEAEEEEEEEEAWGWELVPSDDWEVEGVDGALETPGMPGGKRGETKAGKTPHLMTLDPPHHPSISRDSSNLHHILFLFSSFRAHLSICPSTEMISCCPSCVCPQMCPHQVLSVCLHPCSSNSLHYTTFNPLFCLPFCLIFHLFIRYFSPSSSSSSV